MMERYCRTCTKSRIKEPEISYMYEGSTTIPYKDSQGVERMNEFKLDNPKPCPFCGGTDIEIAYGDSEGFITYNIYEMDHIVAYCKCGCRVQTPDAVDIYDEIDAKERISEVWNKRKSAIE